MVILASPWSNDDDNMLLPFNKEIKPSSYITPNTENTAKRQHFLLGYVLFVASIGSVMKDQIGLFKKENYLLILI